MDPMQMKIFLDSLKEGNTRKASEILEKFKTPSDFHRGYKKALSGIIASVDNEEVNSLFARMTSGVLTKKQMEEYRRNSRQISEQTFRPPLERGYEKAWYDVLSIFMGKKKVGLDKHMEGELY